MTQLNLIYTSHLFPILDQKLIELLKGLNADDWNKLTIAKLWTVKDVAAHLLDTNVRGIAGRDQYRPTSNATITGYADLVAYLNGLNAVWVNAMKRTSPRLLIELLESTGKQFCAYIAGQDPFGIARFPVAWAGEEQSFNWFHIAREYTEKWHHQQQIRLAVGLEAELYSLELYTPHLETSMRALPYHYRDVEVTNGQSIRFSIPGYGDWFLLGADDKWVQVSDVETEPTCQVEIEATVAWRIFTKGIVKEEARRHVKISGDERLGLPVLHMLAVMA